jgi:hypothetical protein
MFYVRQYYSVSWSSLLIYRCLYNKASALQLPLKQPPMSSTLLKNA